MFQLSLIKICLLALPVCIPQMTAAFYLDGGLSYNVYICEFHSFETYIEYNALDLDELVYQQYFDNCAYPDYLNILKPVLTTTKKLIHQLGYE